MFVILFFFQEKEQMSLKKKYVRVDEPIDSQSVLHLYWFMLLVYAYSCNHNWRWA